MPKRSTPPGTSLSAPNGAGRRRFLGTIATGLAVAAGCTASPDDPTARTEAPTATGTIDPADLDTLHVDAAAGTDGTGTADNPFQRIQAAIERATPGTTIRVQPGEYREKLTTVRSGTPEAPITITGNEDAIVRGSRNDYGVIRIHHSHVHVTGLTIEGLLEPDAPDRLSAYVEGQLIQTRPPPATDTYLTDIVIAPAHIGYSRKSLIGLERTANAVIGPLRVTGAAGAEYVLGYEADHNGELLYIGTAPNNLGSDWHPWTEYDETRNVHIHHVDNSDGHEHAEFVDLKPGTHDVTVEYCTDRGGGVVTDEATPTALSHNGHDNVVRWCDIGDAPILVEFDADYPDWTYANSLYENRLHGFTEDPIAFEDTDAVGLDDQDVLCGNRIEGVDAGVHPVVSDCPTDVPDGDGIGHTGGDSPWAD